MSWQERHAVVPAVYMVLRRNDEVLLIRRANTGWKDGMYSLPSGHLEGGESAIHAACREAKEEIGVKVNPGDITLVHTMHRNAEERDHERIDLIFEVSKWEGEPYNAEPEKCDDLQWFDMYNLPDNTIEMVYNALKNVREGVTFSSEGFEV